MKFITKVMGMREQVVKFIIKVMRKSITNVDEAKYQIISTIKAIHFKNHLECLFLNQLINPKF